MYHHLSLCIIYHYVYYVSPYITLYLSPYNYLSPSITMYHQISLCITIYHFTFITIYNYVSPSITIYHHVSSYIIIYTYVSPYHVSPSISHLCITSIMLSTNNTCHVTFLIRYCRGGGQKMMVPKMIMVITLMKPARKDG